jgi:hypothetical protein
MTADQTLAALRALGVHVTRRGAALVLTGAGPRLPGHYADATRRHRDQILGLLVSEEAAPRQPQRDAGDRRQAPEPAAEPEFLPSAGVPTPVEVSPRAGPCFCCGCADRWVNRWGSVLCRRCHPPCTPDAGGLGDGR